jgi:hypothetical protein
MRKYKKSVWLPAMLLVYTTVMVIYFVPRNNSISDMEKYITVAASYIIIFFLWLALRAQEKRREKNDKTNNKNN